jgi:hypothetical protein
LNNLSLQIKHCWSCGHTYSEGRGVCADWFCSEHCRDWYDNGNPSYSTLRAKAKKLWRVITGPPDVEIGSTYYNENEWIEGTPNDKRKRNNMKIQLQELADGLDVSKRTLANGYIKGNHGFISSDGTVWSIHIPNVSSRKWSATERKLSFMRIQGGLFTLDRMPTADEARLIRKVVGLKKKPDLSPELRQSLKQRLPRLAEPSVPAV